MRPFSFPAPGNAPAHAAGCGKQARQRTGWRAGTVSRPAYRGRGREPYRNSRKPREADGRRVGQRTRNTGLRRKAYRDTRQASGSGWEAGRTAAKPAYSEYRTAQEGIQEHAAGIGKRMGGGQDGGKASILGIQDCAGRHTGTRGRHREADGKVGRTAHSEYRTAPEGRAGLAQVPWNGQGSRQDDNKDSALGIQDCAGGQSGTRAGVVKRARQRTGSGAKVRSCRPLAAGAASGTRRPQKKRSGRSRIVSGIS